MKVLLVGPESKEGGMSRYVKDLIDNSKDNEIYLFNTFHRTKDSVKTGQTSYGTMMNSGLQRAIYGLLISLRNIVSFPFYLKSHNPDLVHLCGVSFGPFWERTIYTLISKIFGKNTFLHYLGSFDQFYFSASRFGKFLIRESLKQVDTIAVLSQRTYNDISEFINEENIYLIRSSVDTTQIESYNYRDKAIPKILFIAGSNPFRKGLKDIIKILPSIVDEHNNVRFVFSGSPTVKRIIGQLDREIQQCNVEFIGWFSEEFKWEMYSSADILLLPSYNEGLPYVIIEALASGLPIISTDVGGIPEVIENGQNGYIIKAGDVNAFKWSKRLHNKSRGC